MPGVRLPLEGAAMQIGTVELAILCVGILVLVAVIAAGVAIGNWISRPRQ
jgi:hypothetical protein